MGGALIGFAARIDIGLKPMKLPSVDLDAADSDDVIVLPLGSAVSNPE